MDWEAVWDVGKWVLAALAAGFIGQFGKSLALRLISRRKQRRTEEQDSKQGPAAMPPEAVLEQEKLQTLAKIEKKRAKAEIKRLKKAEKDS